MPQVGTGVSETKITGPSEPNQQVSDCLGVGAGGGWCGEHKFQGLLDGPTVHSFPFGSTFYK